MNQVMLDIITSPDRILQALIDSKNSQTIIGITSSEIGPGTYLASVKDVQISEDQDPLIVLSSYDMTGYFLDKNKIGLSSISSVTPFNTFFGNPFLRAVQRGSSQNQVRFTSSAGS
jgi:hypothetical protein